VLTTHAASETKLNEAVDHIAALDAVVDRPRMIRMAKI
jgi:hypothetical protein